VPVCSSCWVYHPTCYQTMYSITHTV
jgi:hypothetical protein